MRTRHIHPAHAVAALAGLAAVVLACETPADPKPEGAEPEAPVVLNGDAPTMWKRDEDANAGWTRFTVTRSDVVEDGETQAHNGGTYLCYSVGQCWKKCPRSQRDGWSTLCSCERVYDDDPWPLVCTVSEIENEG